ncbi:hypothetical protein llap_14181 [Limosa lapponica baueri]|uniref:Uncharacterized protein n=1 Tax=Limosa lapponica baueri TaxID=1758121 RepID=A0A2I0TP54_LIMLA|nr:hypothetical protein llap_14181 [Limosa lapponica baueri]
MPEASEGTEEGLKPLTASFHAKSSCSFHTQYNTGNIQEGFDGEPKRVGGQKKKKKKKKKRKKKEKKKRKRRYERSDTHFRYD